MEKFCTRISLPKACSSCSCLPTDGTFVLMTEDQEGAPAGDYVVTMQWLKEPPAPNKLEPGAMMLGGEPVDALKGKYVDRKKGFKVKIEPGKTELEPFKLN
jgi:hypothetical protein